jgi:phosphoribosyl-ATP pyrophosphohydrolase
MQPESPGVPPSFPTASAAAAAPSPASVASAEPFLKRLADLIDSRRGADPGSSYVARLLDAGEDAILKKIGEEATETVMAAKDGVPARIVAETADLWFHCLVMLAHYGLRPEDVLAELERREGRSGLEEKARRGKPD